MSTETHDDWTSDRVRMLRKQLTLSQDAFAERVGVRGATISRWERGEQRPTRLAVQRLEQLAQEAQRD